MKISIFAHCQAKYFISKSVPLKIFTQFTHKLLKIGSNCNGILEIITFTILVYQNIGKVWLQYVNFCQKWVIYRHL